MRNPHIQGKHRGTSPSAQRFQAPGHTTRGTACFPARATHVQSHLRNLHPKEALRPRGLLTSPAHTPGRGSPARPPSPKMGVSLVDVRMCGAFVCSLAFGFLLFSACLRAASMTSDTWVASAFLRLSCTSRLGGSELGSSPCASSFVDRSPRPSGVRLGARRAS